MHVVTISVIVVPKCNLLKSIHRSLPGHVNSHSINQDFGLGHGLLKEEKFQSIRTAYAQNKIKSQEYK